MQKDIQAKWGLNGTDILGLAVYFEFGVKQLISYSFVYVDYMSHNFILLLFVGRNLEKENEILPTAQKYIAIC